MIIGNGDIASVLKEVDRDDLLFFASGVSNSQETRESAYWREIDLLGEQSRLKHLVYFSSLSVFYSDSRYAKHKRQVERLVKKDFDYYTIIRLGNILWGTNPYTFINFIRNKLKKKELVELRDEYRYVIDKDEFVHWLKLIPSWNCEMNITGTRLKVVDLIYKYGYLDLSIK